MDYAERGQMLEWDESHERFFFTTDTCNEFLGEQYLKKIFIDILEGLSYRMFSDFPLVSLKFTFQKFMKMELFIET